MEEVAALLTFPPGVTEADVRAALDTLEIEVTGVSVESYNPLHSGPVLYFP